MQHEKRVKLLYKTILRLHKGLPAEIKPLGDSYAKDEFRRHKNCNQAEAAVFLTEWTNYAVQMSKQLGLGVKGRPSSKIGVHLDDRELEHLRDEQVVQLYELMKATKAEEDAAKAAETKVPS